MSWTAERFVLMAVPEKAGATPEERPLSRQHAASGYLPAL